MVSKGGNPQRVSQKHSTHAYRFSVRLASTVGMVFLAAANALCGRSEPGVDSLCAAHLTAVSGEPVEGTIQLKVLLVEFQNVRCRKDSTGTRPRYTTEDFETLLGSEGIYVSPAMFSPDGDPVYGSMNDYYRAMSGGMIRIHAFVINRKDIVTGFPQWIRLGFDKQYYEEDNTKDSIFVQAERAASEQGLDVTTSADTKLAIIYAGNTYYEAGGLNPVAWENRYIMSEVQGRPYNQENTTAHFSRIGIHCHEFAHTIGVGHSSGSTADLMCSGTKNGSVEGNAPAPLNPIARLKLGWAHVIPADSVAGDEVDVCYSLTAPPIYRLRNANGDYFLIENRRFDQMMTIGGTVVPDYNNAAFFPPAGPHGMISQGILVWRVNATGDVLDPGYSTEGLVYASGRYGRTYPENAPSETDDGVPFPGVTNTRILSPWSDPGNPYTKESDSFGSSGVHYTLYVPNTKGGCSCGMEILSEDRDGGSFRVKFYAGNPPNPELESAPIPDSLSVYAQERTSCSDSIGCTHQVLEVGGEVFFRSYWPGMKSAQRTTQLSNGNGGNSAPSLTLAGSTILVVWQVEATGANNYVLHCRRSMDGGISWSEISSAGLAYNCSGSGPRPCVAGLRDGRALLVYSTSSTIFASVSGNCGKSWSAPAKAFVLNKVLGGPSVVITSGSSGSTCAQLAFAANNTSNVPQVEYAAYDFDHGTWSSAQDLSSILPARYSGYTSPCLVTRGSDVDKTLWAAWDASDSYNGNQQVVACRNVDPDQHGVSFRVLSGKSVEDVREDELFALATGVDEPGSRRTDVQGFSLEQNYPNPFNPRTVVSSRLAVASNVTLIIYDLLGREVTVLVNERRAAGRYQDTFDARGLASGVYFYRLTAGNSELTRKMVLAK
jgi:M6 family metalloprotease-like protein